MTVELSAEQAIFIGFKLDSGLRRQIEALTGPDRRYVSADDPTFLTLCRRGEDTYVGKVVADGLTTSRVDDVRRNVLSIMRRLCPEARLPQDLDVWVAVADRGGRPESPETPSTAQREEW